MFNYATIFLIILFSPLVIFADNQKMIGNRSLSDPNYGTHMIPLTVAVLNTSGPVLELGCGDYSTPLLHALCANESRTLISADTDKKWLSLFKDLESKWHRFVYVPVYQDDWEKNPNPQKWSDIGNDTHWSVVLIDHRPGERRIVDIIRLRDHVDVFVVHDTQQPTYGYDAVFKTFKYKYTYMRYATTTTLLSDTIDVAAIFK